MAFRVLCYREIAKPLSCKLHGTCEILEFDNYNEVSISALIPDCDVLVSWLATRKIIEVAKKLKFIQSWGVGVNGIDLSFANQRGIKVSNLAGFNSAAVADYTISAILLLTIRIHAYDIELRRRSRALPIRAISLLLGSNSFGFQLESSFASRDLAGKVLAIVGYGSVGQQIAFRAMAFGMRIMAIKRNPLIDNDLALEFIGTLSDLGKVLKDADFVSITLPLTSETQGCFGAKEFAVMKPSAILLTSSRSEIVDNQALLSALKNHALAGAVLDVRVMIR